MGMAMAMAMAMEMEMEMEMGAVRDMCRPDLHDEGFVQIVLVLHRYNQAGLRF